MSHSIDRSSPRNAPSQHAPASKFPARRDRQPPRVHRLSGGFPALRGNTTGGPRRGLTWGRCHICPVHVFQPDVRVGIRPVGASRRPFRPTSHDACRHGRTHAGDRRMRSGPVHSRARSFARNTGNHDVKLRARGSCLYHRGRRTSAARFIHRGDFHVFFGCGNRGTGRFPSIVHEAGLEGDIPRQRGGTRGLRSGDRHSRTRTSAHTRPEPRSPIPADRPFDLFIVDGGPVRRARHASYVLHRDVHGARGAHGLAQAFRLGAHVDPPIWASVHVRGTGRRPAGSQARGPRTGSRRISPGRLRAHPRGAGFFQCRRPHSCKPRVRHGNCSSRSRHDHAFRRGKCAP